MSLGVRYMFIAIAGFAGMNICIKFLSRFPAQELVFFRALVSLIISYAMLKQQKIAVWGHNKPVLIARGMAGVLALLCYFQTVRMLPLAGAVTLQYLSPVFTAVLAVFIVKEKITARQWLGFSIAFAGVLVVKGFDNRFDTAGLLLGLAAAFLAGLAYNFVRLLRTSEHPLVIVFYFPLVALPVTALLCLFDWITPQGHEWLLMVLIGIFTQIGQVYMTKAIQIEPLGKIAPVKYAGMVYALLAGWFIFDEKFGLWAILGMLLIVAGVLINIVIKPKKAKL